MAQKVAFFAPARNAPSPSRSHAPPYLAGAEVEQGQRHASSTDTIARVLIDGLGPSSVLYTKGCSGTSTQGQAHEAAGKGGTRGRFVRAFRVCVCW